MPSSKRVYIKHRVVSDTSVTWDVRAGTVFGGSAFQSTPATFTRFAITSPNGTDVFFHIVGDGTLKLQFSTGLPLSDIFRVLKVINSSAPFAEFHTTGRAESAV